MFHVVADEHSGFKLELMESPPNAVALEMNPPRMEKLIGTGRWLVLLFAVWSAPDRESIRQAIELAAVHPELSVGIRPFDDAGELSTWCPSAARTWATPVWLVLQDGRVAWQKAGPTSSEELTRACRLDVT
jgi:hypothetical protein